MKKKKIVKKVANIERWFYHYVSEDRKTMEMADERFFFFLNEFVFRFFSAMYSFHFFLSPFLYIYISRRAEFQTRGRTKRGDCCVGF